MSGETNLKQLIQNMSSYLNKGEYVFVTTSSNFDIEAKDIICQFKEKEGISMIIKKIVADTLL